MRGDWITHWRPSLCQFWRWRGRVFDQKPEDKAFWSWDSETPFCLFCGGQIKKGRLSQMCLLVDTVHRRWAPKSKANFTDLTPFGWANCFELINEFTERPHRFMHNNNNNNKPAIMNYKPISNTIFFCVVIHRGLNSGDPKYDFSCEWKDSFVFLWGHRKDR